GHVTGVQTCALPISNPQKLFLPVITDPEYHYEAINVQAQQANASSLLWWTKRLIALRKENEVLGTGDVEFLFPENNKILAFLRSDGKRCVLVVINLSRFAQGAELDLTRFSGKTPVEMFGRTRSQLVLLEIDYVEGDPELYVVPLAFAQGEEATRLEREHANAVVARLVLKDSHNAVAAEGVLVDGLAADTPARLMEAIRKR